jgi:hypothetical protein
VEAQAPAPLAEKKHRLSLPPKRLVNDIGEAPSSREFLSDTAIIGFGVLFEVRLPADELNGDIQIANPSGSADVAPEYHGFLRARPGNEHRCSTL